MAAVLGQDKAARRGSLLSLLISPTALHADEYKGFVIVARLDPEPE